MTKPLTKARLPQGDPLHPTQWAGDPVAGGPPEYTVGDTPYPAVNLPPG